MIFLNKMNVVILHGTLGNPDSNWFPWLSSELEKLGVNTIRPKLPTPEDQNPENWIKVISEAVENLGGPGKEIIFVAHSMSPLAVCHYLEKIRISVGGAFFVSPFYQMPDGIIEPYKTLNKPFIDRKIDWTKVRKNCNNIVCFTGDNDPYIPLDIQKGFAKLCHAKEHLIISKGGHLNAEFGFTTFPLLLEKIKAELKI
jgi:hypothetical protein